MKGSKAKADNMLTCKTKRQHLWSQ